MGPGLEAGDWTFVSDGGCNQNPRNGEVQLALTLDHLDQEWTFTALVVRAAQMSSWNEGERPNAAETRATQKSVLREAVLLPADNDAPLKEALEARWRRFQTILVASIGDAQYAKQQTAALCLTHVLMDLTPMIMSSVSCVSGTRWEGSIHSCGNSVPHCLCTAYKLYHSYTDGQYDFQLRKMGKGRLCRPEDYPYPPAFKSCGELQLEGVAIGGRSWVSG